MLHPGSHHLTPQINSHFIFPNKTPFCPACILWEQQCTDNFPQFYFSPSLLHASPLASIHSMTTLNLSCLLLHFQGSSQLVSALPIVSHWISRAALTFNQPQCQMEAAPNPSLTLLNTANYHETAISPFCAGDCGRWHHPVYYRIILF